MSDPVIEEVEDHWPNGFHSLVLQSLLLYYEKLKVHLVADHETSTIQRLSNYFYRNEDFLLRLPNEGFSHDSCPLELHFLAHALDEHDRLS